MEEENAVIVEAEPVPSDLPSVVMEANATREAALRKALLQIHQDPTLTPDEKGHRMQVSLLLLSLLHNNSIYAFLYTLMIEISSHPSIFTPKLQSISINLLRP